MQIAIEEKEKALLIRLTGHMGHGSVDELARVFDEWLGKGRQNFIVDMSRLQYISSAGLRSMLSASQQVKDSNGQIRLCNVCGLVKDVFVISGFESLFPMYHSYAAAVKFK